MRYYLLVIFHEIFKKHGLNIVLKSLGCLEKVLYRLFFLECCDREIWLCNIPSINLDWAAPKILEGQIMRAFIHLR